MVNSVLGRPPGAADEEDQGDEDADEETTFLPTERQLGLAAVEVQSSLMDLVLSLSNNLRRGGKASMQVTVPFPWFTLAAGFYDLDVTLKVSAKPAKLAKK
jgi:hypothetical protein